MRGRFTRISLCVLTAGALSAAVLCMDAGDARAAWTLVYSQNWAQGTGRWSTAQSSLPGKRRPTRIAIGHPLAPAAIYFTGHCGWGMHAKPIPSRAKMKVVTRFYAEGSQRNALSVNIRNAGGSMVYKYGLGGSNTIIANCQPVGAGEDQPVGLRGLKYRTEVPYDLTSYYDGRAYYVGLKNCLTGEERWSGRRNHLKGGGTPARIDIDQEGGRGPVALGKVEVWLDL